MCNWTLHKYCFPPFSQVQLVETLKCFRLTLYVIILMVIFCELFIDETSIGNGQCQSYPPRYNFAYTQVVFIEAN